MIYLSFDLNKVCEELSNAWSDKYTSISYSEMDGEVNLALRRLFADPLAEESQILHQPEISFTGKL